MGSSFGHQSACYHLFRLARYWLVSTCLEMGCINTSLAQEVLFLDTYSLTVSTDDFAQNN
jgi:hypothetical protein